MKKSVLFALMLVLPVAMLTAQKDQYKITSVGFYNLENLFDTVNDTLINDEEFLPEGSKSWTSERYEEKLANMAYVISQIGLDKTPAGLSILGVSEIENRKVLEDLVAQEAIRSRNYQIVHHDSPDFRGIDVAMIYNPAHFEVVESKAIPLVFFERDKRRYTRDVLYVKGNLDGEEIHIMVNHWPSRRGGAKKSAYKRMKGAEICKNVVDSLYAINPNSKVIIMGDLNDDPTSPSVKSILRAKSKVASVEEGGLFNPMADYYRRGLGSNAYRDAWSLFDQMIFSEGWIDKNQEGYFYYKAYIFNKKYLIQRNGRYKGYPFRTFSFDKYQAGYSDHFPVYTYLLKRV